MLLKLSVDGRLSICAGTLNELPIMLSNKLTSEFQSRWTVKRKRKKPPKGVWALGWVGWWAWKLTKLERARERPGRFCHQKVVTLSSWARGCKVNKGRQAVFTLYPGAEELIISDSGRWGLDPLLLRWSGFVQCPIRLNTKIRTVLVHRSHLGCVAPSRQKSH